MNEEIRKAWVAALRSGEYAQGRGYLHERDTYCCLGVLCDLAERAGVVESETVADEKRTLTYYGGHKFELPIEVIDWAGLDRNEPHVTVLGDENFASGYLPLTSLNDNRRYTFEQIADLIEEQL